MDKLRQAAEQALECLEYHWDNSDSELEDTPYVLEAKQALREALGEPANSTTDFVEFKASSQTEQEPVGYAHVEDLNREHHDFWVNRQQGVNEVPLYTAPQREWVGLSDEEKYDVLEGATGDGGRVYYDTLFRSYEAKLKEKNCDS